MFPSSLRREGDSNVFLYRLQKPQYISLLTSPLSSLTVFYPSLRYVFWPMPRSRAYVFRLVRSDPWTAPVSASLLNFIPRSRSLRSLRHYTPLTSSWFHQFHHSAPSSFTLVSTLRSFHHHPVLNNHARSTPTLLPHTLSTPTTHLHRRSFHTNCLYGSTLLLYSLVPYPHSFRRTDNPRSLRLHALYAPTFFPHHALSTPTFFLQHTLSARTFFSRPHSFCTTLSHSTPTLFPHQKYSCTHTLSSPVLIPRSPHAALICLPLF